MSSLRATRPSARREEILEGLVSLFLAEGFRSFSLDDLAARLHCSKSTLYAVAPSKEQLVAAVVRAFFKRATARVGERLDATADPVGRIRAYLEAIATELAPASPAFFADLDAFGPAREIYAHNTAVAARRLQDLVHEADRGADAAFLGAVAAVVMRAVQRGELQGHDDAVAYRLLADLVVGAVSR